MLYVLQDTTSYNTHYCGFGYSRYTFPGALLRTHTRANNHIVSFAVYVNQISVVYQTFQPDERGVLLNTHDSCLLSYLFAGKRGSQFHEEKITLDVCPATDFCGRKERKYMHGMAVEGLGKLEHRFEITRSDLDIPAGDDAVFDIVIGNLLVRSQERGRRCLELIGLCAFERTQYSHFRHDTACVDTQTGHETIHLIPVGYTRTGEKGRE